MILQEWMCGSVIESDIFLLRRGVSNVGDDTGGQRRQRCRACEGT